MLNVDLSHALITSLSVCKWCLGEKKELLFFLCFLFLNQSRRRKPCSKQDYQCTFPPVPSPACSALLGSFTTPSLLSVCLSLQQKRSSAECGGMGAPTLPLSLSLSSSVSLSLSLSLFLSLCLLTLNCAAQRKNSYLYQIEDA